MKIKLRSKFGFLELRSLIGLGLCMAGLALAVFAFDQPTERAAQPQSPQRDMPTLRDNTQREAPDLSQLDQDWSDPLTPPTGSIVAYAASNGGGVWKSTNCCSATTTWTAVTDDPLISTITIDTLTIDPNDHNTIYAGTGDLNYGSFSMGSQGILKSTDGGNSWTVLGANIFGPSYDEPAGQFPQYNAVGKVRVDPNNSKNVVAGTKKGLYFSYDGGLNWLGPIAPGDPTQRQDITGLELSNVGGTTRILAVVGTRGFATPVQYDLGLQGANGIYRATMPANGAPIFTPISTNANGFVFGTAVTGSPYTTAQPLNATSGTTYASLAVG